MLAELEPTDRQPEMLFPSRDLAQHGLRLIQVHHCRLAATRPGHMLGAR